MHKKIFETSKDEASEIGHYISRNSVIYTGLLDDNIKMEI
jgi:hypothetical protein